MNRRILASLFLIPLLVAAGCNGGGATATTSGNVTTQTETSPPGTVPQPSVLEKQGFASPELPRISAEDLKVIYDNRDPLILVDVRPKDLFDTGYIPGSRNIPNEPQADSLNKLTQLPKDRLIVLYCD
jgi:hypothetical protein